MKSAKLPGGTWTALLGREQHDLLEEAWFLLYREEALFNGSQLRDYGFLVFTAAKAYEGFLKSFFYQRGLISREAYFGTHFRIGKALNPDLPKGFRNEEWLFDDLSQVCGEEIANKLWATWKLARNRVFHFEPNQDNCLNYLEAKERVGAIIEAIKAVASCESRIKNF